VNPPLVLAIRATSAVVWHALDLCETIDAVRTMPTSMDRIINTCMCMWSTVIRSRLQATSATLRDKDWN
jgi:hypothetical protein